MHSTVKSFSVPQDLYDRLRRVSRFTKVPMAVIYREGLEVAVAKWEEKLEIMDKVLEEMVAEDE